MSGKGRSVGRMTRKHHENVENRQWMWEQRVDDLGPLAPLEVLEGLLRAAPDRRSPLACVLEGWLCARRLFEQRDHLEEPRSTDSCGPLIAAGSAG